MSDLFDQLVSPEEPRSFTNQQRRDQFIAIALRLIADGGVESASFGAIAASAGSSKGTVAYHFGSHDVLLDAAVRRIYQTAGQEMTSAVQGVDEAERVAAYVRSNLSWIVTHREETVALVAMRTGSVRSVRDYCSQLDQLVIRQLADLFPTLDDVDDVDDAEMYVPLARALRGSIDAFGLAVVQKRPIAAGQYAQMLIDVFTSPSSLRAAKANTRPPDGPTAWWNSAQGAPAQTKPFTASPSDRPSQE